ncbi:4-hydroxy-tetrahydrodipicolinate reductase [Atopococcus tabaci]|uniref:4-hydroxy-tetrahydrodipicolinate reductase n=1 Tax=Atopococcus tabaci TaxID=269774 RepID=UPI000408F094|nr:4-hydroxy-tetrahydrodipicolinate reductase [Atopococcus tabaci]
MNILLSGYGAMNQRVAALAEKKGYTIVGVLMKEGMGSAPYPLYHSFEDLPDADVVIDFSHPSWTKEMLQSSLSLPLVIATTGDKEEMEALMNKKAQTQPVFFSANMSYGVHVLTELVRFATPLLSSFDIELVESHHNQKVDAPSGTLNKLLDAVLEKRQDNHPVYDRHEKHEKRDQNEIGVHAIRGGTIVGKHEVLYAGHDETISIIHEAQSKDIFANGALDVAEKLVNQPNGYYTFESFDNN